jgi:small subunit ribosomal protein S8
MMTDPIADLLTRMRNALRVRSESFTVPGSRMKVSVLDALRREGFIESYQVQAEGCRSTITVRLKYGPEGESVIHSIRRISSPGCRRYRGIAAFPSVRGGMGISILSTNAGVLSDRECRAKNVGGELLCTVD